MKNSTPKTQYRIGEESAQINVQTILEHYNVSERDLHTVYEAFEKECKKNLIEVITIDLSWLEEEHEWEDADHAETCTSDGKTIYLHNQLSDHWGITTRIYDIMHMGCGHLLQRWAKEHSWLEYHGDKAWEIGSVFHMWASDELLSKVWDYELEAWTLWVQYLRNIVKKVSLQDSTPEAIIQLYSDYVQSDHEYIIGYYKTWVSTNFFSHWKFDQPILPETQIPTDITVQKRTSIEIWLIRNDG